jgi:nucleolar protein 56
MNSVLNGFINPLFLIFSLMMRLVTNVLGVFLVKDGKVVSSRLFPKSVDEVASSLKAAEDSVCVEEEELLREFRSTGGETIYVKNPSRFYGKGFELEFQEDLGGVDVYSIAEELGVGSSEVDDLITAVNLALTRESVKDVSEDQGIMQAIACLDDIDNVSNRLVERLREWYSIHFPELDHIVEDHETYARIIRDVGLRSNYRKNKTGLDSKLEGRIMDSAADSLGVEWSTDEFQPILELAVRVVSLYENRKTIEDYVESKMKLIAPNISALAGPSLGARIITLAGGLKRLSILPAGTIQVIGAEDAFFRFLKTGRKPPKHGVIFQLPEIRSAPQSKRGKLARTFAAKIALASRADLFKGSFIGDKLRREFEVRVNSL